VNSEDYAIVVGIGRYPGLGENNTPLDLKGTDNDVDAMVRWLEDPAGGGLPNANIQIVKSPSAPPASVRDATPTTDQLIETLRSLNTIALTNQSNGNGLQVGRRLYIYMSGHGFSPARHRGCLYTANADVTFTHNVHVSSWLEWFQDAGYFREFVLWMDCCMNRIATLPPGEPPARPTTVLTPPRATFIAFGAQRPLKAAENELPDEGNLSQSARKWRGVFTWTLLEGLKGAAVDVHGHITGRSLADWIRNSQAARLSDGDRADRDVSKEPDVVKEDALLVFARGVPVRTYPVQLSFPPSAFGKTARIWSGQPPRVAHEFEIPPRPCMRDVPPGLHLVEVPGAVPRLRQGFEVVGPTDILLEETGDPVVEPTGTDRLFQLEFDPHDPIAEIFVIDACFALVDGMQARLATPLPFGLYKIKTRLTREIKERVILLDRDRPPLAPNAMLPTTVTAAPVAGTEATHEYQIDAVAAIVDQARTLGKAGSRAVLVLTSRIWSGRDGVFPEGRPWEGITVVAADGRIVVDLAAHGTRSGEGGDPIVTACIPLDPGTYFLRLRIDPLPELEQSLVVVDGWALEVHILRRVTPGRAGRHGRPRLSIQMRDLQGAHDVERNDRLVEMARIALADERKVLNDELEALLLLKYKDPMAGIIGAHLLLLAHEEEPTRDLRPLNVVVTNLRSLVGTEHPDVEALSLRCPDAALRRTKPVTAPPLLQRSWKLLVEGTRERARLVPIRLWRRVHAQTAVPLYLAWAVDPEVQALSLRTLARAMWTDSGPNVESTFGRLEKPGSPVTNDARPSGPASDLVAPAQMVQSPTPQTRKVSRRSALARAARLNVPTSALGLLRDPALLEGAQSPAEAEDEPVLQGETAS
jgi:hypothetical protein